MREYMPSYEVRVRVNILSWSKQCMELQILVCGNALSFAMKYLKIVFYWYHFATYVFALTKYILYHQKRSFISFVGRVLYLNWQAFSRGYWGNFAPIISLEVSHVSSSQISHQTRLQVANGNINFWCAKCGCVLSCRFRIDRPPALHIFGAKVEMALTRILRTLNQYGEHAKKGS